MQLLVLTLGVAVALETVGLLLTWRLIWPAYKRVGKPVFYLGATAGLTLWWGWWALAFVVGHPLLGWIGHHRFCRRHGMNPWRVRDPERYIALQKQAIATFQRRIESRRAPRSDALDEPQTNDGAER